ncbi:sll1863 family stress response protein [Desulfonatronum parangueonense]
MLDKRDAYLRMLKEKLEEWNVDIDRLAVKAKQVKAEKESEYAEQITMLRTKRKEVEDKIAALQKAGEPAWAELRKGIDSSWEALKKGYGEALSGKRKE